MADRSLKGTGLGAKSFEDEAGVEFAARQEVGYDCPRDHHFSLVFSAEADIPSVWECPRCGAESLRADGERPELKEEKPARTHWDMLRDVREHPVHQAGDQQSDPHRQIIPSLTLVLGRRQHITHRGA